MVNWEIIKQIALIFFMYAGMLLGPIFVFGFLISYLNRKFYRICGGSGRWVCYATGAIGVPVHELAHALMCIVFRHRIDEIKLFRIDPGCGVLGYVYHSYNNRSVYQRIGNFFIGVAPIVVGSMLLTLLMYLLLPDFFREFLGIVNVLTEVSQGNATLKSTWSALVGIGTLFFEEAVIPNPRWWVYFAIGGFIGLHMELSDADIKGALDGLLLITVILFVGSAILCFIDNAALLPATTARFAFVGLLQTVVMLQSLFFALVWLLGAFAVRIIVRLVGK